MVNYSWGDKWDERQKQEDLKRFYGLGRSRYYDSGGSGGGGKRYSSYPRRGNHRSRNIAIVTIALVGLGGIAYLGFGGKLSTFLGPSDNELVNNQIKNDDHSTPSKSGSDETKGQIETVQYVIETKTDQVLEAGAFLGPNDIRTFKLQIPNENVSRLDGTIVVDGDRYLHIEFTDSHDGKYCQQLTQCSYDVYGEHSGKSTKDRNNKVSVPVDAGDSLKLTISNPASSELQTVSIDLSVSYQALVERVTPAVIEEAPEQPEIIPAVHEAPPNEEKPKQPEPTSTGVGRDIDPDQLALRVHELINEQRVRHGLAALDWDDKLAIIAEKHSIDMARRDYFSHDTPEGKDPTARAELGGYYCSKDYGSFYTVGIAENLFQHWSYDSITYINGFPIYNWNTLENLAQEIVEGWMDSPGHRQNILTDGYDMEGIGVAIASNDKVYVTEDFC
jgi:uncharacterized protein YkwD